uniref:Uncharacterized protein n=1 Tax=viral metagenome TaxID=1070528 RepID=A0A6C0BJZ2_9ZZZZ
MKFHAILNSNRKNRFMLLCECPFILTGDLPNETQSLFKIQTAKTVYQI